MEITDKLYQVCKSKIKNRTFHYTGSIIDGTKLKSDIEFKAKVIGIKQYLHMGTPKENIVIDITITKADDASKHLLRLLEDRLAEDPEKTLYGFSIGLLWEIYSEFLSVLEITWAKVNSIKLDFEDEKPQITEGRQSRLFVRNAVKYITDLLKNNERGDFYDYSDDLNMKIGEVPFEIHIRKSRKKDFKFDIDAEYSPEDDSITLFIEYNPKTLEQNLYEIIGVLNEYIEHELTHAKQESEYGLPTKQPTTSFKYYSQPHEIEAQRKGFERLAKLRKLPLDVVVKTWYDTHKDIHGLNNKQINQMIDKILS
jgi:hypothetical protein